MVDQPDLPLGDLVPEDAPGMDTIKSKGYKNVGEVVKAYGELNKQFQESIRTPTANSTADEWNTFFKKIGAPETPDGYVVPKSDAPTEEILKSLRDVAHSYGITKKQWDALGEKTTSLMKSRTDEAESRITSLTTEWVKKAKANYGSDFEDRKAQAERAYAKIIEDNPDLGQVLDATKLKQHPAILDMMMKIGGAVSDDKTPSGASGGAPGPGGMEEAQELKAQIHEIYMGDEINSSHPRYQLTLQKIEKMTRRLIEMGYKEGATDPKLNPRRGYF